MVESNIHFAVQQLGDDGQWSSVPFGPFPEFEHARDIADRWRGTTGNPCRVVLHVSFKVVLWEHDQPAAPRPGLNISDDRERGPDDQLYGGL